MAAGPDCEVGVKRYAYGRRNLLFAPTLQSRSGEMVWGGFVSDGFGVKIVWFFEGGRGDSNRKSHCQSVVSLIPDKELLPGRKCCADWG